MKFISSSSENLSLCSHANRAGSRSKKEDVKRDVQLSSSGLDESDLLVVPSFPASRVARKGDAKRASAMLEPLDQMMRLKRKPYEKKSQHHAGAVEKALEIS